MSIGVACYAREYAPGTLQDPYKEAQVTAPK